MDEQEFVKKLPLLPHKSDAGKYTEEELREIIRAIADKVGYKLEEG